jgi:glycerol-3-phosphate dehydrogenase
LPYVPGEPEGKITRRHIICDHEREERIKGLISIIGGKITTYRNLAEQTVDLTCRKLGTTATRAYRTDREPLTGGPPPGSDELDEMARRWHVEPSTVAHLYGLYGSRYREVLALVERDKELGERFCPHNPDIKAEIIYALEWELAVSLADIFLRRTAIGWSQCLGLDCARSAAAVMARYLGWDDQRAQEEVWSYQIELERTFRILRSDLVVGRS